MNIRNAFLPFLNNNLICGCFWNHSKRELTQFRFLSIILEVIGAPSSEEPL